MFCLFCYYFLFVVFCSLTKDMTGKEDVYRGPAIRALCRITDVSVLQILLSHCCFMKYRKYQYLLPLSCDKYRYSLFSYEDNHVTSHWEIHEAGYCWQGAQCFQFSPGLLSGKYRSWVWPPFVEGCVEMFKITLRHCYFCGKLSLCSAHGEDELWCGEALGEWSSGGCF